MTSREAFEDVRLTSAGMQAFLRWRESEGFDCASPLEMWMTAWTARGKHDAEVCREIDTHCGVYHGERYAQAIEEQE